MPLERIQAQNSELASLAMKVLRWTYFAVRPLSIEELQHALAVEPGDSFLDEDGLIDQDLMISVCAGLVSRQESIQEYFERRAPSLFSTSKPRLLKLVLLTCHFMYLQTTQTLMMTALNGTWLRIHFYIGVFMCDGVWKKSSKI
jgi:hypothetical protein